MGRFIAFVVGLALTGTVASAEKLLMLEDADACQRFGTDFCSGESCKAVRWEKVFTCHCDSDDEYFNAVTKICERKKSCKAVECALGECKDAGLRRPLCACEKNYNLNLNCSVAKHFTQECTKKGGTAFAVKDGQTRAVCDCGKWAVMKKTKDGLQDKCVPTTCLHPAISCKDLCEKKLLDKDPRCCEGWNPNDCSKAPDEGTYCSPGSIRIGGKCTDACSAGEGKLLCMNGCIRSRNPARAYECICTSGEKVTEDGITCNFPAKVRQCSDEEKKQCRADQVCQVEEQDVVCRCATHEHEVDGVCTGKCKENACHEHFTDCDVFYGRQRCYCPWLAGKPRKLSGSCVLNEYYYTVSFTPNISLEAKKCSTHRDRVLNAIQTVLGPQVITVEVLSCTHNIKARIITKEPLSRFLRKSLQTCQYPEGDVCMFYPMLPVKKGSATEIEEENLCETLLKAQESAYKGANKCIKEEDLFWFKCELGYREVDRKTMGRLRRSVCQPGVSCSAEEEIQCHKNGHICVYENGQAECRCPKGVIDDNGRCIARTKCNPTELQDCKDRGLECVFRENTAHCVCPEGMVQVGDSCSEPPRACTQQEKDKCVQTGEECVVENDKPVCKTKEVLTTKAAASPAPATCTEEKKQECKVKAEECIVENDEAVCKKKAELIPTTEASPGTESITTTERSPDPPASGSGIVSVSAVLLLSLLIAALPA